MQLYPLKLVTIIANEGLEKRLIAELKRLGATGYTIATAHREGAKGKHMREWDGENIRLETLVNANVAEKSWRTLPKHTSRTTLSSCISLMSQGFAAESSLHHHA